MRSLLRKSKKLFTHRFRVALSYLSYFVNSKPSGPVRLVIFARGRTGSTLLESLLCSTGHFRPHGELLRTNNGEVRYPIQFVYGLSKQTPNENFIFHVKIYQLTRNRRRPIDPAAFLNTLYNDGWKVIYLRRRNKARHVLSNLVRKHRGRAHKFNDDKEAIKLSVNCKQFVERVEERFRFDKAEEEVLANIKYHEVVYEEDLEKPHSHQKTVDRILDYVSLEKREAFTTHRKINTQSLEELIVNYDEFVDQLNKQGWLRFLDD